MSENIKVCPQCDAEYFAHAQKCSSCEVELVLPGEAPAAHAHSHDHDHDHDHEEGGLPWPEGPSEVLMEASLEILEEMGSVLNDNKLPYEIFEKPHVEGTEGEEKAKSCQAGQSEYAIVVPKVHMNESIKITEEHWYKLHPEQLESDQEIEPWSVPRMRHRA